jgi:gamma-glutamylcyclotransferase (GGCT)/AIG2-like uncharacterized protein YtfP
MPREPDHHPDGGTSAGGGEDARARLFVYGTLRRSHASPFASHLAAHSTHLGAAALRARLFVLGWFPGAVPSADPADVVHGDVFEIRAEHAAGVLARLDEYEGSDFERRGAEVEMEETGETVRCWAYFYTGEVEGRERIAGGDWLARG